MNDAILHPHPPSFSHQFADLVSQMLAWASQVNSEALLFLGLLSCILLVYDLFLMHARKGAKQTGIGSSTIAVSVDGSQTLTPRHYSSEMQGLSGVPDALVSENGFIIPVERKPLASKIRDRYIAQLLVYMRLVEEFEGKRPPYGYLILGPSCRKIRIMNTPERQAWLQTMLDEMQAILKGGEAIPSPHPRKCAKCDVASRCSARFVKKATTGEVS